MTRRPPTRVWLDAAPLLSVLPTWDGPARGGYSAMGGVHGTLSTSQERAVNRMRAAGRVTVTMADELCLALGYHPAEVFGAAWWAPLPGEETP